MSRAPRVKINNNLQVAVCRRVGWLSLQRQLFSGSVHGCMVSVLSHCRWRLNLRLDITTEKIQAFVQKTLSFCVSPLAGPFPNDSPCILMFYSCIGVRYLVLSSLHSLKTTSKNYRKSQQSAHLKSLFGWQHGGKPHPKIDDQVRERVKKQAEFENVSLSRFVFSLYDSICM